ncbi:hypothetical protein [Acidovorax sp. sic0104]|uniref:hypothetical protein n=1 Tax=Acidovorax sp. sic0104 TaxID=2854784 RepID=UPI001C4437A3|nr:hypothetical protein [Acidovorax sp. sic0104]MBV7542212.1 hypothetical protein [Acidovorax sp. sic0104]
MKAIKAILLLPLLAALSLAGCSEKSSTAAADPVGVREAVSSAVGGGKAPVLPKIDTSTPDFAVKSWWAYLDELTAFEYRNCVKLASDTKEFVNNRSMLLAGDPLKSREDHYTCRDLKIDRQIKKVHMETETRSVIEVVMRDAVGPRPDEAIPDYAKRDVEQGYLYKYVLVKTPEGWRIEDVLQWNETNVILKRDPWNRIYKVEPKSYYFHLPYQ